MRRETSHSALILLVLNSGVRWVVPVICGVMSFHVCSAASHGLWTHAVCVVISLQRNINSDNKLHTVAADCVCSAFSLLEVRASHCGRRVKPRTHWRQSRLLPKPATKSQICRIQFSCSATNYIVARRPVLRGCWPTCIEQTSTTASSRLLSWYF